MKFNSLIEPIYIIELIVFLAFVTSRDKSVPPFKICELGLFLSIFFKSFIFFGEKYFLSFSFIKILLFSFSISFNRLIVKSFDWENLSNLFKLFKFFAAFIIGW